MQATVDFDCQDAVDKLVCLGLVSERALGQGDNQYLLKYSPGEWLNRYPHQQLTKLKIRERAIGADDRERCNTGLSGAQPVLKAIGK